MIGDSGGTNPRAQGSVDHNRLLSPGKERRAHALVGYEKKRHRYQSIRHPRCDGGAVRVTIIVRYRRVLQFWNILMRECRGKFA